MGSRTAAMRRMAAMPKTPIFALCGTGRVTMCLILRFRALFDSATPIRRSPKSAFHNVASLMRMSV